MRSDASLHWLAQLTSSHSRKKLKIFMIKLRPGGGEDFKRVTKPHRAKLYGL